MQERQRMRFPEGSLLAAMLGEGAPVDVRRAARRLRAEAAPALAVDSDIAALAAGLATSEIARSPAVLEVLPPLFWLETRREDGLGAGGLQGWVVEKKQNGLAARGFGIAPGAEAVPEPEGATTLSFGSGTGEEDEGTRTLRGLLTAISLPELLSQMGESSPILLLPADAPGQEEGSLRGFRLSVAVSPDSAPS